MSDTERAALIVGAGIGGLSAAIALSQRGWRTTVIDVKSTNAPVGVGLNHPANALRALRALGVYDQVAERGYQYVGIRRYTQAGELIAVFEPESPPDVPYQISMTRSDLHHILTTAAVAAGARIELGRTWRALVRHADRTTVQLDDGTSSDYDLVVGADGIRSPLRQLLFGSAGAPVFTGYVCWRLSAKRPAGLNHSEYFAGTRAKATVIHLNSDTMYLLVVEQAPATGSRDPAELADQLRALLAGFPGVIAEVRDTMSADSEIHRAALDEVTLPAPWYLDRVVLIGDAAHAVTPHLAQGAGMAMEDALVLADELDRHPSVDEALAAFTARRLPRVQFVQEQAHLILLNEMEHDVVKKSAFAAALGARQVDITRTLAQPA
jgi:2-polyprenyl-6-methoxyphenol hydroxylase-like FAD-dependent oxidoreductase